MLVYIVTYEWMYDIGGPDVMGVYSSEELAHAAIEARKIEYPEGNAYYYIYMRRVDDDMTGDEPT